MPTSASDVTLLHGDCLDVMPKLAAGSVALLFADLPYNCAKHLAWDFLPFPLSAFENAMAPLLKSNACAVFTANLKFAGKLLQLGIRFRHDLVWQKVCPSNFFLAKRQPLSYHEHILVFAHRSHVYNPQMIDASHRGQVLLGERTFKAMDKKFFGKSPEYKRKVSGPLYPKSVLSDIKRDAKRVTLHPTQKPVALLEWLIKTYSNPGDLVLDPVAGSGTTAIAAMRTGRRVICIEKDATYFAAMQKRVAEEQVSLKLNPAAVA